MKFSLFRNDKSTYKDELILLLFIFGCLAGGIALCIFKPAFWIFKAEDIMEIGILMIICGGMFVPGLIYRFFTND